MTLQDLSTVESALYSYLQYLAPPGQERASLSSEFKHLKCKDIGLKEKRFSRCFYINAVDVSPLSILLISSKTCSRSSSLTKLGKSVRTSSNAQLSSVLH